MTRRFVHGLALLLSGALTLSAIHAQASSDDKAILTATAEALGGLERVRSVKNITLSGYGQYAYMFGGGNITGSPEAPQKYQAANDLKRVYDLEHDRFQQLERRNFLFPFAAIFGHAFAQANLVLDGDIGYEMAPDGKVTRSRQWIESPLHIDGVHMRRMWNLNNPVALVRAALDPANKLSAPRKEGNLTVLDLTLKQGDKLSFAIDARSKLPTWVRWKNPHSNLGQVTLTTYLNGYAPYGGLLMPLGYITRIDWRNIDYFKMYVDDYVVDTQIADLAAPATVRAASDADPVVTSEATQVAPGVWRLTPYGNTVFEFADHLAIYELGGSHAAAQAAIDKARTLVPGKPLTEYIPSHHHFDHTAGYRVGVAEGLIVVSRYGNEGIFREMAERRAPDYPDALEKNRKPFKFRGFDDHLRMSDSKATVDLYWARANTHMADAVFAYVPASKVFVEGDMATAAKDYQFWGDNYMDNVEHYELDVETLSTVHMGIMKPADVIEMVKGGVQRARERCAAELAKGNYFPGCPIVSNRY
jgi:glyoxylase-like metal-dependent hydrolase (beta-lactamase superfamily II)